uniref:SAP domain-containing protein n=1 Tax=Panagrellus redivivus TaxID=6233 RepID=A0A7E4VWH2_PANRE
MSARGLPAIAEMQAMDYRKQLVPLAKKHGVRANMKKDAIIEALDEVFRNLRYQEAARDHSADRTPPPAPPPQQSPPDARRVTLFEVQNDGQPQQRRITIDHLKTLKWNDLRRTAKTHNVKAAGTRESIIADLVQALNLQEDAPPPPEAPVLVREPRYSTHINSQDRRQHRMPAINENTDQHDDNRSDSFNAVGEGENVVPEAVRPENVVAEAIQTENEVPEDIPEPIPLQSPSFYKAIDKYAKLQVHAKLHGIKPSLKAEDIRSALIEKAKAAAADRRPTIDTSVNVFIDMCPEVPVMVYDEIDYFPPNLDNGDAYDASADLYDSAAHRPDGSIVFHPVHGGGDSIKSEPLSFAEVLSFEEAHSNEPISSSPVPADDSGRATRSRSRSIHDYFDELGVSRIEPVPNPVTPPNAELPYHRSSETYTIRNGTTYIVKGGASNVANCADSTRWPSALATGSDFTKSMPEPATPPVALDFSTPKRRPQYTREEFKQVVNPGSSPFRHGNSRRSRSVATPQMKRIDELSTPKKVTPRYTPKTDSLPRWKS